MKKVIKEISKQVGNSKYESKPLEYVMNDYLKITKITEINKLRELGYSSLLFEQLRLDLIFKPSKYLESEEFLWESKIFLENLDKIREEFNTNRKLNHIKVLLNGPPAVGKSLLSQKLSEFYNLPLLKEDVVIKYWIKNELFDFDKYKNLYEVKVLDVEDENGDKQIIQPDLELAKQQDPYHSIREEVQN